MEVKIEPKSTPDPKIEISTSHIGFQIDSFDEALQLLVSGLLHMMEFAKQRGEDPEIIYDKVNDAVSAILLSFIPEQAPTNIEVDAALELQSQQLQEAFAKLKAENPKLYRRNVKAYNAAVSEQRARAFESIQSKKEKIIPFPKKP